MSSEGAGDWSPSVMPIVGDLAATAAVAVVDLDEGLVEVENLAQPPRQFGHHGNGVEPLGEYGRDTQQRVDLVGVAQCARCPAVDSIPQGYLPIRFGFTTT